MSPPCPCLAPHREEGQLSSQQRVHLWRGRCCASARAEEVWNDAREGPVGSQLPRSTGGQGGWARGRSGGGRGAKPSASRALCACVRVRARACVRVHVRACACVDACMRTSAGVRCVCVRASALARRETLPSEDLPQRESGRDLPSTPPANNDPQPTVYPSLRLIAGLRPFISPPPPPFPKSLAGPLLPAGAPMLAA